MRTSADRPSSEKNPERCPRCGGENHYLRDDIGGYPTKEDKEQNRTKTRGTRGYYAVICGECKFGMKISDYFPKGQPNRSAAYRVWNLVSKYYDKLKESESRPMVDVNDLLNRGIK